MGTLILVLVYLAFIIHDGIRYNKLVTKYNQLGEKYLSIIETPLDHHKFCAADKVNYKGHDRSVLAVDFGERLVAIQSIADGAEEDDVDWVRFENVKLYKQDNGVQDNM